MKKKKYKAGNQSRPLYHYTETDRLRGILRAGEIKTANAFIAPGEKPAAWFSYEPHWEPSANKLYRPPGSATPRPTYGIEQMAEFTTPVRIQIDPGKVRLMTWRVFRATSGIPKKIAKALEKSPKRMAGNPEIWRASFEPVPGSAWVSIEEYRDGRWCPFNGGEFPRGGIDTGAEPIDYRTIGSLEEFRQAVDGASVVLARDKQTGKGASVYGTEMLRAIAHEVVPPQEVKIVEFAIDMHTDELEHLAAAVHVVFGFHEYEGGEDPQAA